MTVAAHVNVYVSVSVRCTCTCDCTSILFWWVRKCANILALSRDCPCVCRCVYYLCVGVCVLAVCRCAVCAAFSNWRQALYRQFYILFVASLYLFLVLSIFRLAAAKGFSFYFLLYSCPLLSLCFMLNKPNQNWIILIANRCVAAPQGSLVMHAKST